MKEKYIQIIGVVFASVYFLIIVFIYAAEPRSLAEITTKATSAIETATSQGQILVGVYAIDKAEFERGRADFRAENYVAARESFRRADPQQHDAATQFYVAYSFYRQGWGRFANDDTLYEKGKEQLMIVDGIDPKFRSSDETLKLKTTAELRNEFEEGLKITADDFNPLKIVRERY